MLVMIHDDPPCEEYLDDKGDCPKCKLHPGMQDLALVPILWSDFKRLKAEGRTFMGKNRTRL